MTPRDYDLFERRTRMWDRILRWPLFGALGFLAALLISAALDQERAAVLCMVAMFLCLIACVVVFYFAINDKRGIE